jgi:hypothetical protein
MNKEQFYDLNDNDYYHFDGRSKARKIYDEHKENDKQ